MKKIGTWLRSVGVSVAIRVALAMRAVEDQFKAKAADLFGSDKKEYKKKSNNPVLNKMEQGQTDERYVQQYYEILKKADEFVRTTNPDKAAKVADKHGVNIGAKDKWGMRWDHHGFLDPKHKHYGKTLKEIRNLEMEERKLAEDQYPVIAMFHNKAELSFLESTTVLKDEAELYRTNDMFEIAKLKTHPLLIVRKDANVPNKIEQLTEYVHVKGITSEHFILEFFIPTKYGTSNIEINDPIFKELTDIDQVWFKDEYGDKHMYKVTDYYKRSNHQEYKDEKGELKFRFEIIKFKAGLIQQLN